MFNTLLAQGGLTNAISVHGKGNLGAKPRSETMAEILQSIKERRS